MQRIQLVLVLWPLLQDAAGTAKQFIKPFPSFRWHTLQLPFDIALHPVLRKLFPWLLDALTNAL